MTAEACDVAIVGAGVSGLTAAHRLRDRDVVVLEAEERIGGRSQRVELDGHPTTRGAEGWYDPNPDSPENRLLADVGISTTTIGGPPLLHAGGRMIRLSSPEQLAEDLGLPPDAHADFVRTFTRVRDACAELGRRPVADGLIAELLARSAVDWLGPVHDEVLAVYRRLTAAEQGTYLETSSALQFLTGMPVFGGPSAAWTEFQVPHGGAPMIAVTLADTLPRPPVTGAVVTAIEPHDDHATITYHHDGAQKTLHAERVIVTTPPPVTAEIVRGLSARKRAAMPTIATVPVVEVLMLLDDDGPAPWDGLSVIWTLDKRFCVCVRSDCDDVIHLPDDGTPRPSVIKMMAAGASAEPLVDRSDDYIADAFISDFVDMFPPAEDAFRTYAVNRWSHGTTLPTLGYEQHVAELLRPAGPIHFAGDWCGFLDADAPGGLGTDGDWAGYSITVTLHAAVRAGLRAAAEVRARIEDGV